MFIKPHSEPLTHALDILDGESGSLVIDQETHEVYGHVIGSDPCGFAYVVPMTVIIAKIKACFKTDEVQIFKPSTASEDHESERSKDKTASELIHVEEEVDITEDLSTDAHDLNLAPGAMRGQDLPPSVLVTLQPSRMTDLSESHRLPGHQSLISLPSKPSVENDAREFMEDTLSKAMIPTDRGLREFLPISQLTTIVHEAAVVEELRECLPRHITEEAIRLYAAQICSNHAPSFRRLFAILVLIGQAHNIPDFIDEGVTDDDLPLVKVPVEKSRGLDLRSARRPKVELKCIRQWRRFHLQSFEQRQWCLLAPVFNKDKTAAHCSLHDQDILPFVEDSRNDNSAKGAEKHSGGFGSVFKVKIHPDHHNFPKV
jgi:hypothetical protein